MPDIVITPNRGTSNNPKIDFTGTSAGTIKLEVLADGSIAWNGANGSLFSIADSLSGSLMSVNDISGLPAFEVFSDNRVIVGQFGANLLLGKTTSSSNGRLQLANHTTVAGGIGIGTDINLYRSAAGSLSIASSANPTQLKVSTTTAGGYSQIYLSNPTRDFILTNNAGDSLLSFNYSGANRLQFDTSNQWFNSGNVGIGTTNPGEKLTVVGNAAISNGIVSNSANDADNMTGGVSMWSSPSATTSLSLFKSWNSIFGRTNTLMTNGYATYYIMDTSGRGWVWRYATGGSAGTNVASLRNDTGQMSLGTAWDWSGGYHAQLNIAAGQGSATTYRDIDMHGSWAAGEGHAITATHAGGASNIVGQIVFQHDGPGSRIKFGRLYHSGDQSGYPLELISTGANVANLILNNGNVGLGVTSPSHKLHFEAGSFIGLPPSFSYVPSSWTRGSSGIIMAGSNNADGSGWSYGGRIVEVDEGDGLNIAFDVNYTNSWTNNAMVISGRAGKLGNVGIGTISPSYRLHVEGDSYSSTGFYVRNSAATFIGSVNNMSGISVNGTSYDTFIVSGGNQTITVKSGGNVGINQTAPSYKLDVNGEGAFVSNSSSRVLYLKQNATNAGNIIQFKNEAGGDIWELVARNNQFYIYNTALTSHAFYIVPGNNNVGIATTSPGYKLDVSGTLRSTTDAYFATSSGSVGIGNTSPSYKLHVSGDIYANGGWFRVSGTQGYYFQDYGGGWFMNDSTWIRAYNDKAIITNNEIRGTIFVDANDTAYYVNPATGTNLNGTLVNNGGTLMTGSWNRNLLLTSTFPVIVFNSNNTKYSGIGVDYSSTASGMYFWVNGSSADISGTATVALGLNTGNFVTAYGSFRAPVFYDSDNTGYYLDPASTSDSALRIRGGTLYGPNTTWGAYLMVGGDGRQNYTDNTSTASVTTTNGNLHLDSASGFNSYINWYDGNDLIVGAGNTSNERLRVYGSSNYTEVTGSMRAPLFYDRDDTNYYVDGNNGTALKYLRVNGDWGGSPFGSGHETFTITGTYASMCQRQTNGNLGYWLHHIDSGGTYHLYGGRGNTNGSGWDWAYRAYTNTDGNYVEFRTSARAPIFYDSNDTNYYVDPASTSRVNTISFVSGASFGPYLQFNNQSNLRLQAGQQSGAIGISGYDFNGNWKFQLYGDSSGYGFLNGNWAGWDLLKSVSGNLYLNNQSTYYIGTNEIYYNRVYGVTDIRSPIFYDNDNTAYYCNPAGTSQFVQLDVINSIGVNDDIRYGIRMYDSTAMAQGVGGQLVLGYKYTTAGDYTEGAILKTYKINLTDGNYGSGLKIQVRNHGESLATKVQIDGSGNMVIGGNMTNNAYSSVGSTRLLFGGGNDPNSYFIGTNLDNYGGNYTKLDLRWHTGIRMGARPGYGGIRIFSDETVGTRIASFGEGDAHVRIDNTLYVSSIYDINNTGYYVDPNNNANIAGQIYVGGWFRNFGNQGLYNESYGNHWYATGNDYWNLAGNNASNIGIILRSGGHQGTIRGYVYADSNNHIGFLNNGGAWRLRVVDGDYTLADGSSIRGQLFYDSNDTGYYVNPNSASNLYRLNVAGYPMRSSTTIDMSNTSLYSTSNYYPVVINLPTGMPTRLRIVNALNSNVPSWATHGSGFTLHVEWTSNGSGWGTIAVNRTIHRYTEGFTNSTICGGITQMSNSSNEVIWLRGGGQYYFESDSSVTPTAYYGTYTDAGQSVTPQSSIINNVWGAASTHMSVGAIKAAQFIDVNDEGYYLDPNGTSKLNNLQVAGAITDPSTNGRISLGGNFHIDAYNGYDIYTNYYTGRRFRTFYGAQGESFRCDTDGIVYAYSQFRTPIIYDNNDSGFYVDPNSYSNFHRLSTYFAAKDQNTNWTTAFQNTPTSGMAWHGDVSSGGPTGTWWFYQSMRHSNSSNYWGTQIAYGWEDNANEIYQRNITGNSFSGWVRYLNTNNYSSILASANIQVNSLGIAIAASGTAGSISLNQSGTRSWTITPTGGNLAFASGDGLGAITYGGSIRATSFFDISNTSYYVDPASTSVLNSATFASDITVGNGASNSYIYMGDSDEGTRAIHCNSNRIGFLNQSSGWGSYCEDSGFWQSEYSIRGPVFYDSNDTTYYVDPNNTAPASSNLRGRIHISGGHYHSSLRVFLPSSENGAATGTVSLQMWCSEPGNTWDGAGFGYNVDHTENNGGSAPAYYFGRVNTSLGQSYMRFLSGGDWYFYNTNTSGTRTLSLGLGSDGIFYAYNHIRTPYIYDSNNTAYYFDGNNTSVMNLVTVNSLGVGTSASGTTGEIRATNNITAYYSDERLKTKLGKIEDPIAKVKSLSGFYFEANETAVALGYDKKREVGVSAQEVQAVLPEIIAPAPISDKYMTVRYEKLIPLLIEAIKEQQTQIEQLSNELKSLKNKL